MNYVVVTMQWKDKKRVLPYLNSKKLTELVNSIPDTYPIMMIEVGTKEEAELLVKEGRGHNYMSAEAYKQFISHLYEIFKETFIAIQEEQKKLKKS